MSYTHFISYADCHPVSLKTIAAYMFHTECAVDCTSWLDDPTDMELDVIADFLEGIVNVSDIRDYVEFWREGGGIIDSM